MVFSLVCRLINGRLLCSTTFRSCFKYHHFTKRKYITCRLMSLETLRLSILSVPFKLGRVFAQNRFYSNSVNEDDYETSDTDETLTDSPSEDMFKIMNFQKHILYPNSGDPILESLIACSSLQEVLNIVLANSESFDCEHLSQTAVALWDIQKDYYKLQVGFYYLDVLWNDREAQTNEVLKVYITKRNEHPAFNMLLDLFEMKYDKMDSETLSCTFLFLSKIGLDIRHNKLMQLMLTLLEQRMDSPGFPLTAYSRLAVALRPSREIWSYMLLIKVLHNVNNCADKILFSTEDFHLYTIVMRSCNSVLSDNILKRYLRVVDEFYSAKIFSKMPPNTIIKALSLFHFLRCEYNNTDLMRKLLIALIGREDSLKLGQVIYLQKIMQNIMEPRDLIASLKDTCAKFLKVIESEGYKIPPSLLSSCSSAVPIVKQQRYQSRMKNYIFNEMPLNNIGAYSLISLLKLCSTEVINTFWANCFKYLQNQNSDIYETALLDLSTRYLNFASSMGSSYHNYAFEKNLVQAISALLHEGTTTMKVSKFVYLSSFIISFGLQSYKAQIPENLYSKIIDSTNQLRPFDCYILARSLQSAFDVKKKILSPRFFEQYVTIIYKLNLRLVECMTEKKILSLNDLNYGMRTFVHMKGTHDDQLYAIIVDRYSKLKAEDFSSRTIRNTVYNLLATLYYLPDVFEKMIKYICHNIAYVTGDTMGKVIYACYVFDHKPEDHFLQLVADAITREYKSFNGLNLIQASLGLSYFQHLPMQLVQHIFSVQFLEALDREIKLCYSKELYPSKVRYNLMQLNRVVCLDFLEADVPWFHDKYCQQLLTSGSRNTSQFYSDVLQSLVNLLGNEGLIKQCATAPYGYAIDFLIQVDEYNHPVQEKEDRSSFRRIAILLEAGKETTISEETFSKGSLQLKRRHLEMLNYDVLIIHSSLWTTMYMSDDGAKIDFLRDALNLNIDNVTS